MNNINFPQKREADQDLSLEVSDEGQYENYRRKNLPEGYTAYREKLHVNELVYDQYNAVYSSDERPDTRNKSCCKIGWL